MTLVYPAEVIRRVAWLTVKLLRPATGAAAVRCVVLRVWTALGLGEVVCGEVLTEAAGVCTPIGLVAVLPVDEAAGGDIAAGAVLGGVAGLVGTVDGDVPCAKAAPPAMTSAAATMESLIVVVLFFVWPSLRTTISPNRSLSRAIC